MLSHISPQGFCGGIGNDLSGYVRTGKEFGTVEGATGLREGDWSIEYRAGIARLRRLVGSRTVRIRLPSTEWFGAEQDCGPVRYLPDRVAEPSARMGATVSALIAAETP